jgi:hypothetical protein
MFSRAFHVVETQAFQSIHVIVKTQVFPFFLKVVFLKNKCYFCLGKHFLQVKTVIAFAIGSLLQIMAWFEHLSSNVF